MSCYGFNMDEFPSPLKKENLMKEIFGEYWFIMEFIGLDTCETSPGLWCMFNFAVLCDPALSRQFW